MNTDLKTEVIKSRRQHPILKIWLKMLAFFAGIVLISIFSIFGIFILIPLLPAIVLCFMTIGFGLSARKTDKHFFKLLNLVLCILGIVGFASLVDSEIKSEQELSAKLKFSEITEKKMMSDEYYRELASRGDAYCEVNIDTDPDHILIGFHVQDSDIESLDYLEDQKVNEFTKRIAELAKTAYNQAIEETGTQPVGFNLSIHRVGSGYYYLFIVDGVDITEVVNKREDEDTM